MEHFVKALPKHLVEAIQMMLKAEEDGRLQKLVESGKLKELLNSKGDEERNPVLSPIGTAATGANEEFEVDAKFVIGTNEDGVKISYLGDNFRIWFGGKTVKAEEAGYLHRFQLDKDSLDKEILNTLGGLERAETTLGRVYSLMKKQPNGEGGTLLTNGYTNIFYAEGFTLYVYWYGGGWGVRALDVSYPSWWNGGGQVFSRNPIP